MKAKIPLGELRGTGEKVILYQPNHRLNPAILKSKRASKH
ncbi:hypothetical protein VDG1235_3302 [Verrucomicrobiia bacterium DG1235]|nr:hypothetical protein VDG1235_3302 [Verrucomicrobiae bacterium DG1235]